MTVSKKNEKITTNFVAFNDEDVIKTAYLDDKLKKIDDLLSFLERDYDEIKIQYNKQPVEEVLVQRAVETRIQILYDKSLFDNYANADKVLEDFFTTRRRDDLSKQENDDVQ